MNNDEEIKSLNSLLWAVKKLEYDIYGNGAKGMKEQIVDINKNMETSRDELRGDIVRIKKGLQNIERTIYIAVGGCSVIIFLIDKLVKFL